MQETRDWRQNRAVWMRLLEETTRVNLEAWNEPLAGEQFSDEQSLRAWLTEHKVSGYAQTMLVMERFGYPDYLRATASENS
jgi:hypothetical protein